MSIGPENVFAIAPELRNGFPQTQTVTFDDPIITGNVISGTIAGFAFSVPFNTDNLTTLNDLCAALSIFPVVSSATVTGTYQVTVTGAKNGISLALVVAVSSGDSQANAVIATTVYAVPGATTLAQVNNAINQAAQMMGVKI